MKKYFYKLFLLLFSLFLFNHTYTFAQTGFILGNHGTILKTINGGDNWIAKPSGTTMGLWNSFFINSQTGWIAGGTEPTGPGILLMTTNTGENWITQPTGVTNRWFTGVTFTNSQIGYVIGEHGTILKTTNAGLNWNLMNNGITDITLETINFTDSLNGWITGWSGALFKTTNAGSLWTIQNLGINYNLYTNFFTSSQTGYLAGNSGKVYRTTNQGTSWDSLSSGTIEEIFSIFFINNNFGWLSGNMGTLRYTTNSGNSWTQASITTPVRLESIEFINSSTGWVTGGYTGTAIFKSTNGGLNWFAQTANTTEHLYSVYFYVPPVGINTISENIPSEINLFQNYPNPFNPATKIRFDIPANSSDNNITLKIYNELGKEVAALVDQKLNTGKYEVDWDASKFSSGTYFYILADTDFSITKKMTLVK